MRGNVKDNFEHVKGYRVFCYGRNILIKFKGGDLVATQKRATTEKESPASLARASGRNIPAALSPALPMHCTLLGNGVHIGV